MRWEYALKAYNETFELLQVSLSNMGNCGWELVSVYKGIWYFKRPISTGIYISTGVYDDEIVNAND